jgi:hypothetical protein
MAKESWKKVAPEDRAKTLELVGLFGIDDSKTKLLDLCKNNRGKLNLREIWEIFKISSEKKDLKSVIKLNF